MPSRRSLLTVAALALVATLTPACGDPPEKEIQQAQGAIDTAKAAGADVYAPEEFTAAQDALRHADEAVAQRDYRLALNHALDARERAQNAAKQAVDRKATARVDAQRAVGASLAALQDARMRLKAAEAAHVAHRVLTDARHSLAGAEQAVQEARAALDRSDYLVAIDTANGATARLQGVVRDLDAATSGPARRRR